MSQSRAPRERGHLVLFPFPSSPLDHLALQPLGRARKSRWTLLGPEPRPLAITEALSVPEPPPARSGEGINLLFKAGD